MNVYDKCLELLHHNGWTQGTPKRENGSMCLGYAMDVACVSMGLPSSGFTFAGPWHDRLRNLIGPEYGLDIPTWNDRSGRTFADVKALLVRASADYEAEVAGVRPTFAEMRIESVIAEMNRQVMQLACSDMAAMLMVKPGELLPT